MVAPFLKWAGGKRWLVDSGKLPVPTEYNRYIEPFLGGGAVFFHLMPKSAILSDLNSELIELYNVIRDEPTKLQKIMAKHQRAHGSEYYYKVRNSRPKGLCERAARTLYLNRTCWNGLYRVNLKGVFNVPKGTKNTVLFEEEDFEQISETLKNAELRCADFEESIDRASEGDLVFVDPPYTVKHNLNGFLKYNEKIFSWSDQIRLCSSLERAVARGASIVLTNADHSSVRDLYSGLFRYEKLERYSVLSGKPDKRARTTEALFIANISEH